MSRKEKIQAAVQDFGARLEGTLATEATPNADELLILRNDLGQKAVDWVNDLLSDLFDEPQESES